MSRHIDELVARGEIGGRTVRVVEGGLVDCHTYPLAPLMVGQVRVRTARSAISPGTEFTYLGANATNPYLRKRWDPDLRLFVAGPTSVEYPIVFGYRAAGDVVESDWTEVPVGARVYGKWRHTEFVSLSVDVAKAQRLPVGLSFDDGVDLAQMAPIGLNAIAYAGSELRDAPTVVYGAGPVGLIVAQLAAAAGAHPVHVVDRVAARLEIAGGLGLQTVHATRETDVAAELKRLHGTDGIPVAFECTGSTAGLHEAIRVVRRRGRVVAVGFYQEEATRLFLGEEFHHNGVEIRSAQIGNLHGDLTIERLREEAIKHVRKGRLVLGGLPRLVFPVERAAEAFAALRGRAKVLQAVLTY